MRINIKTTQAIVVDLQDRLVPAMLNPESLISRTALLIRGLRVLNVPIHVFQQYTKGLGSTVSEIQDALETDSYIEKTSFSCLDEPEFRAAVLPDRPDILICGIEAHICIQQTVLGLLHLDELDSPNYRVFPVIDCLDSRREIDKQTAIERMRQEGARIATVESVLFELLKNAKADQFKAISKLVK